MKKLTVLLLCSICAIATLSGCGAKEKESSSIGSQANKNEEESVSKDESIKETNTTTSKDVPEGLNYEFIDRHYGFKFWVSTMNGTFNDAGTNYRFSKNTEGDRADLIIMKYTVDGSYSDAESCDLPGIASSKDIFNCMKNKFLKDMPTPETNPKLEYRNLDTIMVNETEMTKFEGNFIEDWGEGATMDMAFVGYQILAKNRPIMVFVVDQQPSSDNSNINQFYDMLDDIVSTFVDEEGGTKEPGYLE